MNEDFIVLLNKLYNLKSDLFTCALLLDKNRSLVFDLFKDLDDSKYNDMISSLFQSYLNIFGFILDVYPN